MRRKTGAQHAELSNDSRSGFHLMNGLTVTAAMSKVRPLFQQRLHRGRTNTDVEMGILDLSIKYDIEYNEAKSYISEWKEKGIISLTRGKI